MAYYQIQNLDDLKQIYTDVQVVNVVSDDVGQLLLQDDQILLNDGGQQQVVYQTTASANQYQQPAGSTTTHYIIGDDISAQTQQQPQHQQIMLQQHPTMDHHQQQQQVQQSQTQQHYQQDPQQVQVQQMQDHQLQHVQQQQPQQQQPQQLYYTTDQILQQHSTQQPQLHVQQQQQQQQYQQQQIVHQHAMQSPAQQQQQQVQAQPQQQIVYRMQPQQQPQQIHHPQTHAHVIVQQPSGQQVLIQSPQHQEIVMRQPMPQQRIIYNTNRVLYSPHQSQPQSQAILQQSPTTHQQQQQQQQHIQLQKPQEQSQQLQQSVVFHQIQTVQSPQLQIRGAIRAKGPRGSGITGTPTLITRMPNMPGVRAVRPTLLTQVSPAAGGQTMKTPRPRSSATTGGNARGRGASRGGRGGGAGRGQQIGAGRGQQIAIASPVGNNLQSVMGQPQQMLQQVGVATHQGKNITIASMHHPQSGQVRHVYRTQQIVDHSGVSQQQQQVHLVQRSAVASQGNLRFRSPPIGVTPSQAQIQSSPATSNSSSGNYEQDLEESIQAVVVKKDQQKTIGGTVNPNAMDTTLTTYYAKDDDENHRYIRTQNGACISVMEYKKRGLVNAGSPSSTSSIGPVKGIIPMRSGGPPQTNPVSSSAPKLQPHSSAASSPSVPIARVMPQQKMCQQQPQQQQQVDSLSQAAPSSSVHQTSHNNYEIQTQHVLQNRSSQQMAEKDRNSAKMLVILVSGEQRLITFTLPRESCTVQDLLEQVGVPFDSTTTIQCVENPGANIDFVVTVGFSVQESASELISRAEQSLQMSRQQESGMTGATASATSASTTCSTGNTNSSVGSAPPATASVYNSVSNATGSATTPAAASVSVADESAKDSSATTVSGSTSAVKEEVPRKIIQGFYAICQSCGFNSYDHAKCERCKRVFLEPPKRVPCVKNIGTNILAANAGDSSSLIVPKPSSVPEIADKKRTTDLIPRAKVGLAYNAGTGTATRGRGGASGSRGRSTRSGRRAAEIEPVILTLSSDEEEEDDSSNKGSTNTSAVNSSNVTGLYMSITFPTFSFEPIIPDKDETPIYADFNRDDITDISNCTDKLITTLNCKVIRIGTYRFDPEEPVTFTSKGIRIVAPVVTNQSESCALHIHQREVVKIIAHFSKTSDSMLCFYTLRKCAQYIKESLNMNDNGVNGDGMAYFSPNGPYQVRKIILQFDSISDQARSVIKSIWDFFDEISMTDAQDLLQRAAEADRQLATKTNEESNASNAGTTTQLNPNEIRQLLIYPPGKGGISINTEDYLCLATDQYLNDIIIDFYLKWVHNNVVPEQQRQKTFIFSTFFYKRLTTLTRHQHQDKEIKQTAAQKRHTRVQNWTKNVNLFEKDFVIIPINEQSHWFLAIICFPRLVGPVTFDTNVPVEPQQIKKQNKGKKVSLQIGNTTITPLSKRVAGENNVLAEVCGVGDDDSERDEAEGDESDLASEDSDFENSNGNTSAGAGAGAGAATTINTSVSGAATTTAPSTNVSATTNIPTTNNNTTTTTTATTNNNSNSDRPQAIKQPLILIFDSLAGASRSRVVATLRDYLTCEYKAKMPEVPTPRVFNKDSMPGHCVKVPQQNNFTDCGLYLLQYVEHFFNDPIRDYRMPIKQLSNWFDTLTVTRKREDISILLQKLMNEKNGPNQKIILPDIPFPTQNGQLVEPPEGYNIEFEEEDLEEEAVEEEDEHAAIDTAGETTDMEVGTDEVNAKASAAKATTALVPTQGRKIVVKRRMQIVSSSSSSNNEASSPTPANTRSMIKIRKIDQ